MVPELFWLTAAAAVLSNGALASSGEHSHFARGFPGLKVVTAEEHAARNLARDQRIAHHEARIAAWQTNQLDKDKLEGSKAILAAASAMEQAGLRKRADASSGGSMALDDSVSYGADINYQGNITIGTPGQRFVIDPDNLWVPGSSSTDPGHDIYTASSSSTSQVFGNSFNITYGIGFAAGKIAEDSVTAGGFTVQKQFFGIATQVDQQSVQATYDGIMGLASSAISQTTNVTFFENLIANKQINNPYFSMYLARGSATASPYSASTLVSGSSLCFGCTASLSSGVSTSGSQFWVPIGPVFAYYEVPLSGFTVAGTSSSLSGTYAIVDSGTTALYLPTSAARSMMSPLNGQLQSDGSYIVPVSSLTTSTQVTFNFNGGSITVNPVDLVQGYSDRSQRYYQTFVYAQDMTGFENEPMGILGDVFIKNSLTTFSYSYNGAPAVGFQQISSSGDNINTGSIGVVSGTAGTASGQPATITFARSTTRGGFTVFTSGAAATGTSRAAGERGVILGSRGVWLSVGAGLVGVVVGAMRLI